MTARIAIALLALSVGVGEARGDARVRALRCAPYFPATTNVVLHGDVFNSTWVKGTAVIAAPVVTDDQAVAPWNGQSVMDRVVFAASTAAGDRSSLAQSVTLGAGVHTLSVYLQGVSGAGSTYLFAYRVGGPYHSALCSFTTAGSRCTFTTPSLAAGAWFVALGVDRRAGTDQTSIAAADVYAGGFQIEPGTRASPYIPTAATSASRAAGCFR